MATDVAIFAAMVLADLFAPIPAELIMSLDGFHVHEEQLSLVPVVGAAGAWLGLSLWEKRQDSHRG